ncbi:MAG TPA: hypothetical protein VFV34_19265, partial [Blastocatellia bacterium]|nr:hypothetical protein [Blastocatellia bacterium]
QPRVSKQCQCGVEVLQVNGSPTRMRHNLRCFFLGHNYRYIRTRDKHDEYACEACGHPLLLESPGAPLENANAFHKAVSFSCILKGHRLHQVSIRNGFAEYACACGHSFLLTERDRLSFRHPAVCVIKGHYILFVERHSGHDEFRCGNCGHPFSFAGTRSSNRHSNDQT